MDTRDGVDPMKEPEDEIWIFRYGDTWIAAHKEVSAEASNPTKALKALLEEEYAQKLRLRMERGDG